MTRRMLDGMWSLGFTLADGRKFDTSAPVPGNVEPELVKLGLIDDYMPADYEYATEKFEAVDDWTYTTEFDAPPLADGYTRRLVFEGIDTIAEVYLNGERLLDCMNMHMTYTADVTDRLYPKKNQLKVVIRSSQLWAREHCHDNFVNAHGNAAYFDSQSYLRKARHQWGWDNAPRLITAGIIRSVYIEDLPPCRFEEVYTFTTSVSETSVGIGVSWIWRTPAKSLEGYQIRITLLDGEAVIWQGTQPVAFIQGMTRFGVGRDRVKLWWPSGFGEPYLYTLRLEMLDGDGNVCAVHDTRHGIRTLKLERTDDITEDGGEFVFRINGEKVFIRGTNWKPLDPLASEADKKTREGRALREISALNCNMVRIWGGGIYEDEAFFDYCDSHGIMVWQDFMLACEIPTNDDWYRELVGREAIQIIKKQRNHPSLAVWCGDNENDECVGWMTRGSEILPSHSRITRETLRQAVLYHDPYRSYVDSSPYASDENYRERGGTMTHFQPETHMYPKTTTFAKTLRESRSLFIGEVGPIQVNAIATNAKTFEREKARMLRLWDSPNINNGNQSHQSDNNVRVWRNAGKETCLDWFGRDFSFEEWGDYTLAINLICAEVFKDVIEYCRVKRWSKTGVIWWSLVDMWPMLFNYSVIDHEFNRKLPYYWIRSSQQEFALMGVREELGGELALYAANDTRETVTSEYTVTAYDEAGEGRVIATGICRVGANSTAMIQRIAESEKPQLWIIRWQYRGRTLTNHVFTGRTSFEAARRFVKLIGEAGGYADEILEL